MDDDLFNIIAAVRDVDEALEEKFTDDDEESVDYEEVWSNDIGAAPTDDELFGNIAIYKINRPAKMRALSSSSQKWVSPDFNYTMEEIWRHNFSEGRTKLLSTSQLVKYCHLQYNEQQIWDVQSSKETSNPSPPLFGISSAYTDIWVKNQLKDREAVHLAGDFDASCVEYA